MYSYLIKLINAHNFTWQEFERVQNWESLINIRLSIISYNILKHQNLKYKQYYKKNS